MRKIVCLCLLAVISFSGIAQIRFSSERLEIDCAGNTDSVFRQIQVERVEELILTNLTADNFPKDLSRLTNVRSVKIFESQDIHLGRLMSVLKKYPQLQSLSFDNSNIKTLSPRIRKLKKLEEINITNNPNLDVDQVITQLKKLDKLETLALPINNIVELPEAVGELSNIKTLDLTNNYLSDLPEGISRLDSLENLSLEENIIVDPVNTLSKLEGLNIKYISLDDQGLSEEELDRLKEVFPNSSIRVVKEQAIDTLENNRFLEEESESAPKKKIGSFMVKEQKFKAYSTAYLYYPYIYRDSRLNELFDSTSFDDRYLSYDYINVWQKPDVTVEPRFYVNEFFYRRALARESRRMYGYFGVKAKKVKLKDGVVLSFFWKRRMGWGSMYRDNPEMNIFNRYNWVYRGSLSKKELKKIFRRKSWLDIRVDFDKEAGSFRLELKGDSSHFSLDVMPVGDKKYASDEKRQAEYVRLFKTYEKSLSKRKKLFERKLRREKGKYLRGQERVKRRIWNEFQRKYMSVEERLLSREEWLAYYEQVLENESEAIYNADAKMDNIIKGVELKGFYSRRYYEGLYDETIEVVGFFYDLDSNEQVVTKYLVVDKEKGDFLFSKFYYKDITLNNKRTKGILFFESVHAGRPYDILVELKDGNVGIVKNYVFNSSDREVDITVELLDKSFSSVGQVYNLLGI